MVPGMVWTCYPELLKMQLLVSAVKKASTYKTKQAAVNVAAALGAFFTHAANAD